MFINLTNHPSSSWSDSQRIEARKFGKILDIPFPQILPTSPLEEVSDIAENYFSVIKTAIGDEPSVVHLMGEFTFVFSLLLMLKESGIPAVASTTERKIVISDDGSKITKFEFVRFRNYY